MKFENFAERINHCLLPFQKHDHNTSFDCIATKIHFYISFLTEAYFYDEIRSAFERKMFHAGSKILPRVYHGILRDKSISRDKVAPG